jgi:TrmH family RNA methyltransferase
MYSNIRIVLVETSHPGNIGAVARAMKNMFLDQLYLVSPQNYPNADATARASGADDVLANAQVVTCLEDALQGCSLVVGASARLRSLSWPVVEPPEAAKKLLDITGKASAAVVFGREHSGLTNKELELCHYLVHIPSNPEYSSLNIAAAVQVICYEIHMQQKSGSITGNREELPASADEMQRFYEHLEQTLVELDFLDPDNPRQLMRRLKRMYNRTQPDPIELNILRGILTAINKQTSRKHD